MTLIISTCSDKLSEKEFVRPIQMLVKDSVVKHYSLVSASDIDSASKIIISGTALKDFEYLKHDWTWLKDCKKPVLGICAGMHALHSAFGVKSLGNTAIGPQKVKVVKPNKLASGNFEAYFLHTKLGVGVFEPLALTDGKSQTPCMFQHPDKPLYGTIFHPEVLNPDIINNFLKISP